MSSMGKNNRSYYETHKDKYTKKTICDICNGTYNWNNKSYHFKSKKHITAIEINNKEKEIENREKEIEIREKEIENKEKEKELEILRLTNQLLLMQLNKN